MSGPPRVSVVIPAFNCGPYLGEALESVFIQTLAPHEILVVDDGSTDDTPAVLARYADRIRALPQPNAGVSAARNRALDQATGEFVALMDADDVMAPSRLERQVRAIQAEPEAVASFCGHWTFHDSLTLAEVRCRPSAKEGPPTLDFLAAVRSLTHDVPLPPTLVFRRPTDPLVRFPLNVRIGEDVLFCAMLRTKGRLIRVPEPLYGYRVRPGSASRTQTPVDSFEQRLAWVTTNREEWCPERTEAEVRRSLWDGFADVAEAQYWSRQGESFVAVRDHLRAHWPATIPPRAVVRWRWLPDWAWRAREALSGVAGPARSLLKRGGSR